MTPRPSTEQLLVQVLMRYMQEVLRTLVEHPEGAPNPAPAHKALELAFAPIWNRLPYLTLDFFRDRVQWNDIVVLVAEEDEAGLAGMLSRSGIHAITLVPGVEKLEVRRFLEVLDRKRRLDADGDQDLVAMLFREDLHHVRYTVGRAPSPTSAPAEASDRGEVPTEPLTLRPLSSEAAETLPLADATSEVPEEALKIRDAVRADARAADDKRGVVQLESFDSTLYFLDEREIDYLRTAIQREYAQDHARNVLALLLDILQLHSEPGVRDDVIAILTTLMPYLLGTGRFDSVAYLTGEVRSLTRTVHFEQQHKKALDALRVSVSETHALQQLFHVLDDGDVEPTSQSLGILLRELRPEAIQAVLVWIGQLTRADTKRALIEAVEAFFTQWPNALKRMILASDRTVVHRALGIANKLKLAEFADVVGEVLEVDDATTRGRAARALSSIGTAPALRHLVTLVEDPDEDVRKVVFEGLAARPYRGGQEPLRSAIASSDLEDREIGERRALFRAYGAVAGADGVSTLEPLLFGKGWVGRRSSPETRACAAVALGVIGSPAARLALEKANKDRDPVVRSAASAALRKEE